MIVASLVLRSPLRRLVSALCFTIAALLAGAPLLLGPALGTAMRALGGEVTHACACGMPWGTCGCPECERVERARQATSRATVPVLKSACDSDDAPAPQIASIPLGTISARAIVTPPVLDRVVAPCAVVALTPRDRLPPPTPPPRA